MKPDLDQLRSQRGEILERAERHGARNVRVFGSAARGETTTASDVDLLVEMEVGRSMLDFVGLWQELEDLLGGEAFFADRRTQDAVLRNIGILGQAVKGLSAETRALEPEVPWRQVAGCATS